MSPGGFVDEMNYLTHQTVTRDCQLVDVSSRAACFEIVEATCLFMSRHCHISTVITNYERYLKLFTLPLISYQQQKIQLILDIKACHN